MNLIFSEVIRWAEFIVQFMPGRVGMFVRYLYFRKIYNNSFTYHTGLGCEFQGSKSISIGKTSRIGKFCFFSAEEGFIEIGEGTTFNMYAHINANDGGKILIGNDCIFGPGVIIRAASHGFEDSTKPINLQNHKGELVMVGNGAWIGSGSIIMGGVKIGAGSIIGAGSVVTKDVPDMEIFAGVPARAIRKRL